MRGFSGLVGKSPYFWLFILGGLWGANFLFMKYAAGLGATRIVWLRLFFGAAALTPFLPAAFRAAAKTPRLWLHVLVMSLAANVLTFHCFMEGTKRLGAGLAGVISGSVPLMTALLAAAFLPGERLGPRRALALGLSFAGIVVILEPWRGLPPEALAGTAAMFLGALGYAVAFVYARRFLTPGGISPLGLAALQMAMAAVLYAPLTDWTGMTGLPWTPGTAASVILGLGALGAGAAYVIYYALIEAIGAVAASSVSYLPPLVALALGGVFLGEPIHASQLAGVSLVLGGIFMLRAG